MSEIDFDEFRQLLQDPTLEDYGTVLEILVEELFAERGSFWLERENQFIYRGDEKLREKFPFSRQAVDSVLDEGRAFLCLDSREDFRVTRHSSIAVNSVRSVLCAAARDKDGEVLVLAYFDIRGTAGKFSKEDLAMLKEVLSFVPGAVKEADELEYPPIPQAGVLAWVDGKVVLITSKGGGRWVIPKGHVEAEDASVANRAAQEAFEEAGLSGELSFQPVGEFYYEKKDRPYRVTVYDMRSCKLADDWPEKHKRKRVLVSPEEAASMVNEPGLGALILRPR